MPQAIPDARFPGSIWDGTTSTTDDTSIEKSPDIEMGNRLRAELRAIETTLQTHLANLAIIHAYGNPANILIVNSAGTGIEWAAPVGGGGSPIEMTNDNAGTIVIGTPVYVKSNGNVDLAKADMAETTELFGLVAATSIASLTFGNIQIAGILEATTGQWDAVTGDTGGLAANAIYYLDKNTGGRLTTTAPTTADEYVVQVGQALSTTKMNIRITTPILL